MDNVLEYICVNLSNIIVVFCCIWLGIYLINKNNNYIDIRTIIKNHYKIFRGNKYQLFTFIGIPMLLSFAMIYDKIYLTQETLNALNTILAIIMPMFFCLLGFMKNLSVGNDVGKEKIERIKNINLELFNTLLFECVIGTILFVLSFIFNFISDEELIFQIYCFIFYFLYLSIFMNLFIVLKRTKKLYDSSY